LSDGGVQPCRRIALGGRACDKDKNRTPDSLSQKFPQGNFKHQAIRQPAIEKRIPTTRETEFSIERWIETGLSSALQARFVDYSPFLPKGK